MLHLTVDKNSDAPVYLQIKKGLEEYIATQCLPADAPLPHVGKIAEAAGVCVRTADQALLALVEEGVCYRKPKRGTFVARGVERVRRATAGISCPYKPDSLRGHHVENSIYAGLIEAGSETEVQVFFLPSALEETVRFYQRSQELDLKGVALLSGVSGVRDLEGLAAMAPTRFAALNYDVFGDSAKLPENVFCVFNDDFESGRLAGERMLSLGLRKFAVLSLDVRDVNYRRRVDGFKAALRSAGVKLDDKLELVGETPSGEFWPEDLVDLGGDALLKSQAEWIDYANLRAQIGLGRRLVSTARAGGLDFEGVFCVNDYLAFGAFSAGLSPALEIVGCDNIHPDLSKAGAFSTVAVDFHAMGVQALKALSFGSSDGERVIRIKPRLLVRSARRPAR